VRRETEIVFLAGEAFFLRGSHDLAVTDKRSRRIMIKAGNSEYVQPRSPGLTDASGTKPSE
jgi:hypothetical protein